MCAQGGLYSILVRKSPKVPCVILYRKLLRKNCSNVVNEEYIHPEDDELYLEDSEYQEDDFQYYEDNSEYSEYYEGNDEYFEQSQEIITSCESCDRDFYSKTQYDKHMLEHRTCNLDGCKFTAHAKIIEKHVLMQHATGLYDKIRNINTPEDIARWVEERKKRYPNRENILKRQEKQEDMLKRGVRIKKNENRFGRDKFRLTKADTKKPPPKKKSKQPFIKEPKPVSLINEKIDWNGSVCPFRGTSVLESDTEKEQSDFEDDEWSNTVSKPVTIKLNNALGALMGAYMSGGETDEDEIEVKTENKVIIVNKEVETKTTNLNNDAPKVEEKNEDSDCEAPTEVKIEKEKLPETVIEKKEEKIVNSTNLTRKRKRSNNRLNKSAKFKNTNRKNFKGNSRNGKQIGIKKDFPYAFRRRRVTLLEKLLENEIRHERNILLQCIKYTVENNFFRDNPSSSSTS